MDLFIFIKNPIGRFLKDRTQIDTSGPVGCGGKGVQYAEQFH
jgi:hypothetical protein